MHVLFKELAFVLCTGACGFCVTDIMDSVCFFQIRGNSCEWASCSLSPCKNTREQNITIDIYFI
jgi:hypothetical protein